MSEVSQEERDRYLTQPEREQLQRMLSQPEEFPRELGAWIEEYLSVNVPEIPYTKVRGLQQFAFGRGDTLPEAPTDGQFFSLSLSNGVVWNFRYNESSSSSFKWEFIGGPPLVHAVNASETCTSGSYSELTTDGPTLTMPLAGEYLAVASCHVSFQVSAGGRPYMGVHANGSLVAEAFTDLSQNQNTDVSRSVFVTLSGANQVIKMRYKVSAQNATYSGRLLFVTPTRVG